ncbi:MAG: glycoside hydrolase family 16 protein [Prevotella sp.]|nr:glycoside hydrolase family 16 protein [Prevotella sp.]
MKNKILMALFAILPTAVFGQGDDVYQLIFSDEFNQEDGSRPDSKKWAVSTRRTATWNRWISASPDVAFIRDGALVCRAIPNPDISTDNVPMITGSMETRNLFSFTYGKVEVRLKTIRHRGNFPAAWMMPHPPCDGWPNAGEIDIFETIDNENVAYHTIHTKWSYTMGNKNNPKSSFNEWMDVENWHVYGLIWEKDLLIWTVDGNEMGRYAKSSDEYALANGQWPFTAPFYLILNQSVGNGSWAANADTDFTYETMFDYIRVYQKKTSGIENFKADDSIASTNRIYDLQGRKMLHDALQKGFYINNGKKFIVK